jgi:hypothetical protein
VALGLAFLGAALPLLPTTPFLLVAAYAFARSSPQLHAWLTQHSIFGPLIENWRRHGAISPRVKWVSIAAIIGVLGASWALRTPTWMLAVQAAVLSGSALFILTRPNGPRA